MDDEFPMSVKSVMFDDHEGITTDGRRRRGWWRRNIRWAVPAAVVGSLSLVAGLAALLLSMVFGMIKSYEPYREAVAAARGSAAVAGLMGSPIEEGFFITGTMQTSGPSGRADLAIPISGPKRSGTIHVEAERYVGKWNITSLEVEIDGTGIRIDLLPGIRARDEVF